MLAVSHLKAITQKIIDLTSIYLFVPISIWHSSGTLHEYKKIKVVFHAD